MNSRQAFAVDGMPEAIGLQIAWNNGDVSEQVSFVHGAERFLVGFRAGAVAPPHFMVLDATARLARMPERQERSRASSNRWTAARSNG